MRVKHFVPLLLALALCSCGDYSDGVRVGVIQKLSHKGWFVKTWEGDMLLGGLVNHSSTSVDSGGNVKTSVSLGANVWSFTVEDQTLVDKVQAFADAGTPVKVTYHQEMFASPFRTETSGDYFLVSIEAIK
jgi:hypothetical protein